MKKKETETKSTGESGKHVITNGTIQFALRPNPKTKDIESHGRHLLPNKKLPVKIEWEKTTFKDEEGKHIKPSDLNGYFL